MVRTYAKMSLKCLQNSFCLDIPSGNCVTGQSVQVVLTLTWVDSRLVLDPCTVTGFYLSFRFMSYIGMAKSPWSSVIHDHNIFQTYLALNLFCVIY